MKARAVFSTLCAVFVGLLVWALVRTDQARRSASAPEPSAAAAEASAKGRQGPLLKVEKRFVVVSNEFNWSQLESEDYKTYIERLRAVGCPEQTIRDLIIADLDKVMAPQFQALYGRKKDLHYWQSEEEELLNDLDVREVERKQREVERQKRAIVRELVNIDLRRERLQAEGREDYYDRRLRFLPEERRDQVREVFEKYDDAEQRIRAREFDDGDALTLAEEQQLRMLRQQRAAEVAELLSPAERQQYELWMSPTANTVRFAFYGMNATEQEFLAVYQAQKAFDETWGEREATLLDPATRQQMDQARQQMEDSIHGSLGDQRYAQYKMGERPEYHQLCALTTRFKLPREKAADVYGYKLVLDQFRQQVALEANLTVAQKAQALKDMAQETERAVAASLGDRAFRYYLRTGQGSWIRGEP